MAGANAWLDGGISYATWPEGASSGYFIGHAVGAIFRAMQPDGSWSVIGQATMPLFQFTGTITGSLQSPDYRIPDLQFTTFMSDLDVVFNGSEADDTVDFTYMGGRGKLAQMNGGGGSDYLYGSIYAHNDISGGDGVDYIFAQGLTNHARGGSGGDHIRSYYDFHGRIEQASARLDGDDGDDFLFGGRGNDTLDGGDGNDQLYGADGGDDLLLGGAGDDTIWGANGSGRTGDKTVDGGQGVDLLVVSGGLADYRVELVAGSTTQFRLVDLGTAPVRGSFTVQNVEIIRFFGHGDYSAASLIASAFNLIPGTDANNTLTGTAGRDRIDARGGDDVLRGMGGGDVLLGGAGNDRLDGGTGADHMSGGAGNDSYTVDDAGDVVDETGEQGVDAGGVDSVSASVTFALTGLARFVENLTLTGAADINGQGNALANRITGNAGANSLGGGEGNDTISGGAGNDVLGGDDGDDRLDGGAGDDALSGGEGADMLSGGLGADYMSGGNGNDTYVVDDLGDVVDETVANDFDAGGVDKVQASVSFALSDRAAFVENLTLTGSAAVNGEGNGLANRINGNAGANVLKGHGGNDVLSGGAGADVLEGGSGNDRLDGGADDDALSGGDGDDRLNGGLGADLMAGGAGNDGYTVDQSGDVVDETDGAGADAGGVDSVSASVTFALSNLARFVENLTLTGSAHINGDGNDLANRITGNAGDNMLWGHGGADTISGGAGIDALIGGDGADRLDGGLGADVLIGGAGQDTLTGGEGADTFFLHLVPGEPADRVMDFSVGVDRVWIGGAAIHGVAVGQLDPALLTIGAGAVGAQAQFVYNPVSRVLSFDLDGQGGAAGVALAAFNAGVVLQADSIWIV